MLEHIIDILAPHHCVGCKSAGSILCEACRLNITEVEPVCYRCEAPTGRMWRCNDCNDNKVIDGVWVAGLYDGALKEAVSAYKFFRAKHGHRALGELLHDAAPLLPEAVVTAVPTSARHRRQRGYDQAALLARRFATLRGLPCQPLLTRRGHSRQLGASRRQRFAQAAHAFATREIAMPPVAVVIDDVVTTGATIEAAARALKAAGVTTVYVAALAYEPLRHHEEKTTLR